MNIDRLTFGTASLGNLYREISDEQALATLHAAWDAGVRSFDTAPHYGLGLAERRLGEFLRSKPRAEFTVSTKVGRVLEPTHADGASDIANGFAVPANYRRVTAVDSGGIRRSIDDSLRRLGLDSIDTLYLHDPEELDDDLDSVLASALPALEAVRSRDGIRFGVGTKSLAASERAVEAAGDPGIDIVMCSGRYTLLEQPAAQRLLPLTVERGVDVIAVSVYASGLLATAMPRADAHDEYGPVTPSRLAAARTLASLAESHGVDLPTVAVQYPLRHPAIGAIAIGAGSPEHATEAARRVTAPVPQALWDELAVRGAM